jgi:hypothetical protein
LGSACRSNTKADWHTGQTLFWGYLAAAFTIKVNGKDQRAEMQERSIGEARKCVNFVTDLGLR